MPTTPTDDPLANSDRTVGVHAWRVHAGDALKREALLFDQIAIPGLDLFRISGHDLFWLRDIGIVRDTLPIPLRTMNGSVWTATRDVLASSDPHELVVYIGEPISHITIPDKRYADEVARNNRPRDQADGLEGLFLDVEMTVGPGEA